MFITSLLAITAFFASIVQLTNFIGLGLGGSLAFVILLLGYFICWIVDLFQKTEIPFPCGDC